MSQPNPLPQDSHSCPKETAKKAPPPGLMERLCRPALPPAYGDEALSLLRVLVSPEWGIDEFRAAAEKGRALIARVDAAS